MTNLDRNERQDGGLGFWSSIGRLPGVLKLTAGVYCVIDPLTSWTVRAAGLFALIYLVSPIDLIPDFLIVLFGLGALDDMAVIYLAYNLARSQIKPQHVKKALAFYGLEESGL